MKRQKGFTLIELMIVVAIIGILAAIAVPKFVDLVTRAKEAATFGNLGALRSAITIYYADHEYWPCSKAAIATGTPPGNAATFGVDAANPGALVPKYIKEIPAARLREDAAITNPNSNVVLILSGATTVTATNAGGWVYAPEGGELAINSTAKDTKTENTGGTKLYWQW